MLVALDGTEYRVQSLKRPHVLCRCNQSLRVTYSERLPPWCPGKHLKTSCPDYDFCWPSALTATSFLFPDRLNLPDLFSYSISAFFLFKNLRVLGCPFPSFLFSFGPRSLFICAFILDLGSRFCLPYLILPIVE